jgi:hypothetical protein
MTSGTNLEYRTFSRRDDTLSQTLTHIESINKLPLKFINAPLDERGQIIRIGIESTFVSMIIAFDKN